MTIPFEDMRGALVVGIGVGIGFVVASGIGQFIAGVVLRFLILRRGDRAGKKR